MERNRDRNPAEKYLATVKAMGELFDYWNERQFGGALKKPVITVYRDKSDRAYGWFLGSKVWKGAEGEEGYPEINMSAQYLSRPFEKTAATLLHEMCHLCADEQKVADTSANGRYHNKAYKAIAEAHGLTVKRSSRYGYNVTELTEESRAMLEGFLGERRFLYDSRIKALASDFTTQAEKRAKESRPPVARYPFRCPKCGQRIKSYQKEARLLCADCALPLEAEEN